MSFLKLTRTITRNNCSSTYVTTVKSLHQWTSTSSLKPILFSRNESQSNHASLMKELNTHLEFAKKELSNKKAIRALGHYRDIDKLFKKITPHELNKIEKEAIAMAFTRAADIVYHTSSQDFVALEYLQKALDLVPGFDEANKLKEAILLELNLFPMSKF
jgi:hypothetical protein